MRTWRRNQEIESSRGKEDADDKTAEMSNKGDVGEHELERK
jgi:hypothetical protein